MSYSITFIPEEDISSNLQICEQSQVYQSKKHNKYNDFCLDKKVNIFADGTFIVFALLFHQFIVSRGPLSEGLNIGRIRCNLMLT
jgi:hypothetical protein